MKEADKKLLDKVKNLALKINKLGTLLDKYDIPFELSYKNNAYLKSIGEEERVGKYSIKYTCNKGENK